MIQELVVRVFVTRNYAHLEHWRVKSGYTHETLGVFYDDVIEKLDAFVEASIATFEQFEVSEIQSAPKIKKISDRLEEDLVWISENRNKLVKKISALDNLLQDLEDTYLRTLFKLKNLS